MIICQTENGILVYYLTNNAYLRRNSQYHLQIPCDYFALCSNARLNFTFLYLYKYNGITRLNDALMVLFSSQCIKKSISYSYFL